MAGRLEAARAARARWVLARAEGGWEALITDESDFCAHLVGLADDARSALGFPRERNPMFLCI